MSQVFVEMSKALYDRETWARSFDDLLASAEGGADGLVVRKFPGKAAVNHETRGVVVRWTNEKREAEKFEMAPKTALYRKGDGGRSFLHAQNW